MSRAGSSASYKKFTVQRPRIFQLAIAHCLKGARRKSAGRKVISLDGKGCKTLIKMMDRLIIILLTRYRLLSLFLDCLQCLVKSVIFCQSNFGTTSFSEIFGILPHWRTANIFGGPEEVIGFPMSSSTGSQDGLITLPFQRASLKYSQDGWLLFAWTIPRVRAQRLWLAQPARDTAHLFLTESSSTGRLNPVMLY